MTQLRTAARNVVARVCFGAAACGLLVLGVVRPAEATCTAAGSVVTCTGAANPLAPNYANAGNNLNVTVNAGSTLGVLLGIGGTALNLPGNNVTLNNAGTIDPSLLGLISVLSSGTVVGNSAA